MYLLIQNGRIALDTEHDFRDLDSLQNFVGGYIEAVSIPSPSGRELTGYINEEGRLEGLPPNVRIPDYPDPIVGPMVITATDEEGATVPLTREEVEAISLVRPLHGGGLPHLVVRTPREHGN